MHRESKQPLDLDVLPSWISYTHSGDELHLESSKWILKEYSYQRLFVPKDCTPNEEAHSVWNNNVHFESPSFITCFPGSRKAPNEMV